MYYILECSGKHWKLDKVVTSLPILNMVIGAPSYCQELLQNCMCKLLDQNSFMWPSGFKKCVLFGYPIFLSSFDHGSAILCWRARVWLCGASGFDPVCHRV